MNSLNSRWVHIALWVGLPLLLAPMAWSLAQWAVVHAVFAPNLQACQAQVGVGACWGVVAEKWRVIVFGRYPLDEQWRAGVVLVVWSVWLWATVARRATLHTLLFGWLFVLPGAAILMGGGAFGLPSVPTALWGGLPLTLILSTVGFGLALPLGVLLALGRRFGPWWVRALCTGYIELLRALPLVTVLFLATFVLPLWLPGEGLDLLHRVLLTLALFSAAYLAEVVRGGLQNVPYGQFLAAKAMGLNALQCQWWVILPQALRACLPSLVNSFVTLFKECSLVTIVALFELTGALSLALAGDVQWRSFYLEGYLFIALVYWLYCYGLSKSMK